MCYQPCFRGSFTDAYGHAAPDTCEAGLQRATTHPRGHTSADPRDTRRASAHDARGERHECQGGMREKGVAEPGGASELTQKPLGNHWKPKTFESEASHAGGV